MPSFARLRRRAAAALLGVFALAGCAVPEPPDATLASFVEARRVLDAAANALGGHRAIDAVATAHIRYRAHSTDRAQGAAPGTPADRELSGEAWFDLSGQRVCLTADTTFRGGVHYSIAAAVDARDAFVIHRGQNELFPLSPALRRALGSLEQQNPVYMLPHGLIQSAFRRPAALRSMGRSDLGGERHDGIGLTDVSGVRRTLWVHTATGLPARLDTIAAHPVHGDVTRHLWFDDYHSSGATRVPHRVRLGFGDTVVEERRVSQLQLNEAVPADCFVRPDGIPTNDAIPSFAPQRLADGVWFIQIAAGLAFTYNTMAVEFDDGVAVFDAPLSDGVSRLVLRALERVMPDKPVHWIIPTHHHHDHIGGLRAYVARGATVVTTEGNVEFFRAMTRTSSQIAPFPALADVRFEVVRDRKHLRDATGEIVAIDLGRTSHVDEMQIVYLPRQRMLWVADLFSTPLGGSYLAAPPGLVEFAAKLRELELDIDTVVPAHGRPVPFDEFLRVSRAVAATDAP